MLSTLRVQGGYFSHGRFISCCLRDKTGSECSCISCSLCLCLVAQSYLTLCYPMDYSLPDPSVLGDSPGKNTGVGCHALLQGIFSTQGSNPGLLHCRQILYHLSHQGNPASSVQFSSVAQLCPTLCNPMDCIMPGFLVHHQLPELTQTHVHQVGDAVQPSHPLLSPSPAFSLSQHQSLSSESVLHFRWPKYWSFASASVLPKNIQD